jgi:hypothetical protein
MISFDQKLDTRVSVVKNSNLALACAAALNTVLRTILLSFGNVGISDTSMTNRIIHQLSIVKFYMMSDNLPDVSKWLESVGWGGPITDREGAI